MTGSGRTPIYGPEPWRTTRAVAWSYWDQWFCVVAVAAHDGDLDALAAAIEDGGRSFSSGTVEAKLSHLDDLRPRLTEAGIDAAKLGSDRWMPIRELVAIRPPRKSSSRACTRET